jgi:hypothetical protein
MQHTESRLGRNSLSRAIGIALGLSAAGPSLAQSVGGNELEEITVTATRRTENLQNVPIAITALTGNTLSELTRAELSEHGSRWRLRLQPRARRPQCAAVQPVPRPGQVREHCLDAERAHRAPEARLHRWLPGPQRRSDRRLHRLSSFAWNRSQQVNEPSLVVGGTPISPHSPGVCQRDHPRHVGWTTLTTTNRPRVLGVRFAYKFGGDKATP